MYKSTFSEYTNSVQLDLIFDNKDEVEIFLDGPYLVHLYGSETLSNIKNLNEITTRDLKDIPASCSENVFKRKAADLPENIESKQRKHL